ncbi:hypothetical protein PFICI_13488 [Pestalotiopsis fici W106-1]|uniref:Ketosynthase family 3 (KS3) domain-containing protein n=1 Tax=Pestalotiopsis fici (strain W106-1 / CGMCC3.15140) TaxID=1229662 RepID=W3WML3_PESFW|nr:uncharacterized protein PFICI_13488 [Pestalotiopsis fici W106-1]ETS75004.1 hypothetical protein PFICI_13488 [Pestalotiopsis fici W106-1]
MFRKNVARQFPADRISNSKYDATNESLKGTPHNACFLERNVTAFDAEFFGMSSDEDLGADPQQRVLLEVTYRALEDVQAIVAGCDILLSPDCFIALSALGFLSPDGVCQSFDSRANGYGRGEGFGVLIIKSVDDAVRDGDTIRAIIRATGTNQNGRTTLAHPSKEMQAQLIQSLYDKAQLNPLDTQFFEAHGTGTAIGDPLEAMAIGKVFGRGRSLDQPLIIGALKANIGHLEGCTGIAGVLQTILVLEHGTIPSTIPSLTGTNLASAETHG